MRKLTVAVCTDERGGMMFNNRRVSRDRILIDDLVVSVDGVIYIDKYSSLLFEPHADRVTVLGDVLADAPAGAVCFVEVPPIMPHAGDISRLIIYNWNRQYPFDRQLDISPVKMGFKLVAVTEFEGSSHEKITKEIYER